MPRGEQGRGAAPSSLCFADRGHHVTSGVLALFPGHDGGLDFLMARLNKHLLPQAAPHRQFVTAVRQTSNTRTLGVFSVHFLRFPVLEIRTHAKSPDGPVCEVPRVCSTLQQIGKVSLDRERAHCSSHRGLINLCSLYISLQLWLT